MKNGFSAYSSPVIFISRKVTEDKKTATDFRHFKVRTEKNNFPFSLLKDTFLMLGTSRCEILSALDLKDAFHSLGFLKIPKDSEKFYHMLAVLDTFIKECLWD